MNQNEKKQINLNDIYEQLNCFRDFFSTTLNNLSDINYSLSGYSPHHSSVSEPQDMKVNMKVSSPVEKTNCLKDLELLAAYFKEKAIKIEGELRQLQNSIS